MNVLLVVAYFYPEIGSASHLFFDLARGFIKKGHNVEVLTSYPRSYNIKHNKREKRYPTTDIYEGIKIHRSPNFQIPRDVIALRGLEHFIMPLLYLLRIRRIKNIDMVIIYSPPLPLFLFGIFLKKLKNVPFILNVQDLYPQTVIDVGMLKGKLSIGFFEWLERKSYKDSDFVTAHSENNLDFIRKRGAKGKKSGLVYNWTDINSIIPGKKNNTFRKNNNIEDKFLISYAGIMSYHQDLKSIVKSAKYLEKYKNIMIYMVGDGVQKMQLESYVKKENIQNVEFLPMQEKDEYIRILQASDIGIVTLGKEVKTPVVPGKLINLMSASIPVLANVPVSSDAYKIVLKAKCGYVVEPGNPEDIANKILGMYESSEKTLKDMGKNGRKFVEREFSSELAVVKFEKIFENIKVGGIHG